MATDKMDSAAVYMMQDEIKKGLKGQEATIQSVADTVTKACEQVIERIANQPKAIPLSQKIVHEPQEVHHKHRHSIDVQNSNVVLTTAGLFLAFAVAVSFNILQYQWRQEEHANSIKYRIIKMYNPEWKFIDQLEKRFRVDPDFAKEAERQVDEYEAKIRQAIEAQEHARRSMDEAEQVKKEAERMKK